MPVLPVLPQNPIHGAYGTIMKLLLLISSLYVHKLHPLWLLLPMNQTVSYFSRLGANSTKWIEFFNRRVGKRVNGIGFYSNRILFQRYFDARFQYVSMIYYIFNMMKYVEFRLKYQMLKSKYG